MRAMTASGAVGVLVLGLMVASCGGSSRAPTREPTAEPAPGAHGRTPPVVPAEDAQLPVAEAVAKLHRRAFEPTDVEATLGRPICLITIHDAALQRGEFFPLVLFANGAIGGARRR
jgi:hypothetical protein